MRPATPKALSILGLLRPHWIAMTLALVGVAGEAAASLLEPWPLKIVLDYLLQARPLPGWMMPLLTILLFVVLELLNNNVLEPWIYGSNTGVSPVALIFAAVTFRLWKSGVTRDFSSAAGVTTPDAWNHVVATWNGSSMEIWANGISRGSTALSAPIDAGTEPLFVGSVLQSYDWFKGAIDEVAVYGSALSAERILAHYSAAVPLDATAPAVTLRTPANGSTMDLGPTFGGAAGVASGDGPDVTVDVYTGASVSGTPICSRPRSTSFWAWSKAGVVTALRTARHGGDSSTCHG